MRKWITALVILALTAALPAGFAAAEGEADEACPAAAEEPSEPALIGMEPDGEDGYQILLTNAAGAAIVSVAIQPNTADEEDWSDELLAEDALFADGEEALFCYIPQAGPEDGSAEENEQTRYNLRLLFDDETESVLHFLLLSDMEKAEIRRTEDGVAYIVYDSLSREEEVDTAETEQRLAKAAEGSSWSLPETDGSDDGANSDGCIDDGLFF